ncbi:DUF6789 family protein [Candidatus Nitrosocosmicus hydrocola]|uniref:DUF6789 family protein n=1 Tax=Candidatus Nitrosocosmicus hydrocola TaxID=1826872 RepID=UPI0011E5E905|nr:DUF6789 family protein [Candidatus Nitrosocosmicus hydrocola]
MINKKLVKNSSFGAIGGIIASITMYPFLFLTTSMMGLPLDDLSIARGMAISNINDNYYLNLTLGILMHLLTGAISGAIFGIIVSTIKKLAITNFKRGIMEGIIFSIIIYMGLFIPTTLGMVMPNLFDIMNQSNPTQSSSEDRQTIGQNLIPIYGFGFIAHIVFGIVLGVTTTFLFKRGQMT